MTSRRRAAAASAAVALLFLGAAAVGCGDSDDDGEVSITVPTTIAATGGPGATTSGPPTVLAIVSPAVGAQVGGNVVSLDLTTSGITIVPADGNTSGSSGHFHVYIDRDPPEPGAVIPVAAGIIHTTDDPVVIPGMAVGPHRISVVFGDGTHRRLGFSEAGTSFTVTGPSIDASTPPNAPAGQPVALAVTAEGLAIPADAVLYVLVDRDAPPAGVALPDEPGVIQASETTVAVPDLAPGTHTLWVVAGTPDRLPLDPPVMDKVTVTVG